jgi:hypothetical protein
MTLRGRQSSGDFEMVGTASETYHSLCPSTFAQANCLDRLATSIILSRSIATIIVQADKCHDVSVYALILLGKAIQSFVSWFARGYKTEDSIDVGCSYLEIQLLPE